MVRSAKYYVKVVGKRGCFPLLSADEKSVTFLDDQGRYRTVTPDLATMLCARCAERIMVFRQKPITSCRTCGAIPYPVYRDSGV